VNIRKRADRHNKASERVFGLLDYLFHHRPNDSAVVNVPCLMQHWDGIRLRKKTDLAEIIIITGLW